VRVIITHLYDDYYYYNYNYCYYNISTTTTVPLPLSLEVHSDFFVFLSDTVYKFPSYLLTYLSTTGRQLQAIHTAT